MDANTASDTANDASAEHFQPIVIDPVTRSSPPENFPKRPKKSYRKKVDAEWSHVNTLKLIEEIEMRRSLWDVGCSEYKMQKDFLWQEVADATNMSINNCKGKWANLRITFNANLEKQRKKKLRQGSSETPPITWKYFHPMLFLESNKVVRSTKPTSSFQLSPPINDEYFVMNLEEEMPIATSNRRKTDVSTPFDSNTCQSRESNIKEMAVDPLQSMRLASKNPSPTASARLCEYMASELDTLAPQQATLARLKLSRAFNEIMEDVLMKHSPQVSMPITFKIRQTLVIICKSFYDDSHDGYSYGAMK